jgi:hypothetical protein
MRSWDDGGPGLRLIYADDPPLHREDFEQHRDGAVVVHCGHCAGGPSEGFSIRWSAAGILTCTCRGCGAALRVQLAGWVAEDAPEDIVPGCHPRHGFAVSYNDDRIHPACRECDRTALHLSVAAAGVS